MRSVYDVIIIGGGINGTGIARDAAERGLSVYLAEKKDFGYGTSFRSTKLIHGGLRYLEHYEIGLVRESLREREILLRVAPHLVRPIKFVLPIYEDHKYGYGKVKLGLVAYDLLSYDKSLQNHQAYSTEELLSLEPHLRKESLKGGFGYFDCQILYPERMCVENVIMAKEAGADVHNYTEVVAFLFHRGRVAGVRVRDRLKGEACEVYARTVVNAAGPWVDEVLRLQRNGPPRKIGGTKGSHILLSRFPGGPDHALYLPAYQDGRPFFVIPWREYYWVGTTDIRYDGDLDAVQASQEEIEYLLREVNFVLPEANVTERDVLYCLAGIRPLPYTGDDKEEAEITRRHIIFDHEDEGLPGLISIIGGKLTTFRSLAEETVDYLFELRKKEPPPCQTATIPTWGGGMKNINRYIRENKRKYSAEFGLEPAQVEHLIALYGKKFWRVLELTRESPDLLERICPDNPDIKAQIVFALQNEFPRTLADILLRRTGIGTSACRGLNCAKTAARVMGKYLRWRRKRIREEIEQYEQEVGQLFRCP